MFGADTVTVPTITIYPFTPYIVRVLPMGPLIDTRALMGYCGNLLGESPAV
jgi:hypothetical protein